MRHMIFLLPLNIQTSGLELQQEFMTVDLLTELKEYSTK